MNEAERQVLGDVAFTPASRIHSSLQAGMVQTNWAPKVHSRFMPVEKYTAGDTTGADRPLPDAILANMPARFTRQYIDMTHKIDPYYVTPEPDDQYVLDEPIFQPPAERVTSIHDAISQADEKVIKVVALETKSKLVPTAPNVAQFLKTIGQAVPLEARISEIPKSGDQKVRYKLIRDANDDRDYSKVEPSEEPQSDNYPVYTNFNSEFDRGTQYEFGKPPVPSPTENVKTEKSTKEAKNNPKKAESNASQTKQTSPPQTKHTTTSQFSHTPKYPTVVEHLTHTEVSHETTHIEHAQPTSTVNNYTVSSDDKYRASANLQASKLENRIKKQTNTQEVPTGFLKSAKSTNEQDLHDSLTLTPDNYVPRHELEQVESRVRQDMQRQLETRLDTLHKEFEKKQRKDASRFDKFMES
jgi:hypothetical protein